MPEETPASHRDVDLWSPARRDSDRYSIDDDSRADRSAASINKARRAIDGGERDKLLINPLIEFIAPESVRPAVRSCLISLAR